MRSRSLAEVLPIAAVEPDGLIVTTDGAYVRLLECDEVLHARKGGPAHRETMRDRLGALAARLPAGESLQVVVEADTVDPDVALERDWREIRTASDDADDERRLSMERLGFALEQTVRR